MLAQTGLSFDLSTSTGKLMRTIMAGLAEFERDLIRERMKSGLARAKAVIERDGHFITKGGKRWAKLGRKKGYRPSEKHVGKVLELHKDGPQLSPDRPQSRIVQEHRDGDRSAALERGGEISDLPVQACLVQVEAIDDYESDLLERSRHVRGIILRIIQRAATRSRMASG